MPVTITEEYKLPSLGKIYQKQFDPNVKLRSMTVEEEMKRLSPTSNPYKIMAEIIENCLMEKLPISVYDLCLGDYIYLLHKLRITTYGPDYNIQYRCPNCGSLNKYCVNLDEMKVNYYNESVSKLKEIILPKTGKEVKLRFQTPRDLDKIQQKKKDMLEKFPEMTGDPTILLTLETLIESIDGEAIDHTVILDYFRQLPMADTNLIAQTATKLNEKVGIDTTLKVHCDGCNSDVKIPFRFTNEFFGPTVY